MRLLHISAMVSFPELLCEQITNPISDDVLFDLVDPDSDSLGLDHLDRSRNLRNGAVDLFLK